MKDTARNILANREFVVNLVTEELFEAMNVSAADFPFGESELIAAGLHAAPSEKVKPPLWRSRRPAWNASCTVR